MDILDTHKEKKEDSEETHGVFFHENNSVDLLLQELNLDGLMQTAFNSDETSPAGSPVKPLNLHTQIAAGSSKLSNIQSGPDSLEDAHQDPERKDFNSSSDTYVSDNDDHITENSTRTNSGENNTNSGTDTQEAQHEAARASPSKSIMKSSASVSPKKSVVFQPDLDTFHTYTPKEPDSASFTETGTPVDHMWQEIDQSMESPDRTMSPPAPPPHSSNTITGLLSSGESAHLGEKEDDSDPSHLEKFRKTENGYSNLSLNDKLNAFLESSPQTNQDDLDIHLDQLGRATNEETDVNIHRLSYHLEEHHPGSIESPFNALSRSQDLYISSVHSSQSSLQSLADSNRNLEAETVAKTSRGIQFNDGIKGFSDPVASSLIPLTGADNDSFSDESSVGSRFSFSPTKAESVGNANNSYDQSYNSTEKSILNLLNSASQLDLPLKNSDSVSEKKEAMSVKEEDVSGLQGRSSRDSTSMPLGIKKEDDETHMKHESDSGGSEYSPEYEDPPQGLSIKQEQAENRLHEEVVDFKSSGKFENVVKSEKGVKLPSFQVQEPVRVKQEQFEGVYEKEPEPKSPVSPVSKVKSEKGSSPRNLEKTTSLSPLDFDEHHSFFDNSLSEDGQDPGAHTFQVDERAVVPGLVKLVRSAESTPGYVEPPSKIPEIPNGENGGVSSEDESREMSPTKLETEHHAQKSSDSVDSSDSANSDAYEDSVDYSLRSLAPTRTEKENTQKEPKNVSGIHDPDSSVLANSSNVNPPLNISLPVVETNDNEFADLTERINENSSSFEEALSAEHDAEKKSFDFLSIWHSQSLGRRPNKSKPAFYQIPSISKYNTAEILQTGRYHIPSSLQPKKFTDINLVSTRVVSSNSEDFNVSAFLPELSQDSGLEGHFRDLIRNDVTEDTQVYANGPKFIRRRSIDSSNILSELKRENSRRSLARASYISRRKSISDTLRPESASMLHANGDPSAKKSKFHVPSFEIKRSDSVLSPKNQYNDIFHDGSFVEPTIKAPGMTTLPSMDRDDVKKIMQMKQAMSLEEYSGLKKLGSPMKTAVKQGPIDKHEMLQQQASIYCASMASNSANVAAAFRADPDDLRKSMVKETSVGDSAEAAKPGAPHLHKVLSTEPVVLDAIGSKNTAETAHDILPDEAFTFEVHGTSAPNGSPVKNSNTQPIQKAPKVYASLNPFRESAKALSGDQNPDTSQNKAAESSPEKEPQHKFVVKSWNEVVPAENWVDTEKTADKAKKSARSSPIKINSPVKIVRENGSVTGVYLDKKTKPAPPDLHNKKLRGKNHLSTVSVPSNVMSEMSSPTRDQSAITQEPTNQMKDTAKEKGKLFFRVVGIKNVNSTEMRDRDVAFNLTLDNGIHCIKTPNYSMKSSEVSIDKEFELSVSDSLEFILTLKASYSKTKPGYKEVKERKVVRSKTKIGRLFGSKEIVTTTKYVPQDVVDPLESVLANDGSFARCYVDLDMYCNQITGKSCTYDLVCYNEWATYTHNGTKVVKNPYSIAQLEVKMLYVPRSESYEILPTSIKSAYESLDDLKKEKAASLEGYLHQEGGDCETWKRRWFTLKGTSMVAHSEFSHKTRAKINLAKVTDVIFVDKENHTQSPANYRNFSDILLMENSFKIRFANGEVIDFGAPSKMEKALWIKTIQEIVYRNKFRRQPWVQMMQEKNAGRRKSVGM